MSFKKYQPILEVLLASIVIFIIHELVFLFFDFKKEESGFQYSLPFLYLLFSLFSIIIVLISIKVKSVDINNVGNGFLLLTLIKIGIAYLFLNPILASSSKYIETEKMNFFIVFAVFLTIETVVTIRMLNNKQ